MIFRNKKAQSTLEITLLATLVIGALLALQLYVKRAVVGKIREDADSIGEQFDITATDWSVRNESFGTTTQLTGLNTDGTDADGVSIVTSNETRNASGGWTVQSWAPLVED